MPGRTAHRRSFSSGGRGVAVGRAGRLPRQGSALSMREGGGRRATRDALATTGLRVGSPGRRSRSTSDLSCRGEDGAAGLPGAIVVPKQGEAGGGIQSLGRRLGDVAAWLASHGGPLLLLATALLLVGLQLAILEQGRRWQPQPRQLPAQGSDAWPGANSGAGAGGLADDLQAAGREVVSLSQQLAVLREEVAAWQAHLAALKRQDA